MSIVRQAADYGYLTGLADRGNAVHGAVGLCQIASAYRKLVAFGTAYFHDIVITHQQGPPDPAAAVVILIIRIGDRAKAFAGGGDGRAVIEILRPRAPSWRSNVSAAIQPCPRLFGKGQEGGISLFIGSCNGNKVILIIDNAGFPVRMDDILGCKQAIYSALQGGITLGPSITALFIFLIEL